MNFSNIPFSNIVRFGQQTMLERPLFTTSWILGRFCNYNCSYCWPYARSNEIDHYSLKLYQDTVDTIKKQATNNGFTEFHWSFSGGEPTTFKQLPELIRYLSAESNYQSIHMTTNLSPGFKWWSRWATDTAMLARRSLTASFHDEFADEHEFGEKILQLMNDNVYVTINQVMVPTKFYELYTRLERFANRGINVTLKPQSNQHANAIVDGYDDTMIKYMQEGFPQQVNGEDIFQIKLYDLENNEYQFDQAERFNAFGFNKFEGWNCNSGYQSIIIRGNDVKRSYSCQDIPLGTLTDGFNLFQSPQKCTTNICFSSADSKVPKCKIN